ncbi:hypothetical protein BH18THE1_BH18THE1_18410 [soil metagenome]
MTIEQVLQEEIQESKRWVDKAEGVYKRDLTKRVELINWVLDKMKKPDIVICEIIERKMNEIIDKINQTHDVFVAVLIFNTKSILENIKSFYQR